MPFCLFNALTADTNLTLTYTIVVAHGGGDLNIGFSETDNPEFPLAITTVTNISDVDGLQSSIEIANPIDYTQNITIRLEYQPYSGGVNYYQCLDVAVCRPNACGGFCGDCPDGQKCVNGKCEVEGET
jgi:hypothetical protein